jgi:hypothetical protein
MPGSRGAKGMADTQDLKARAEALFKRSGEGGTAATDEYEARCRAIAEKTKRLRDASSTLRQRILPDLSHISTQAASLCRDACRLNRRTRCNPVCACRRSPEAATGGVNLWTCQETIIAQGRASWPEPARWAPSRPSGRSSHSTNGRCCWQINPIRSQPPHGPCRCGSPQKHAP